MAAGTKPKGSKETRNGCIGCAALLVIVGVVILIAVSVSGGSSGGGGGGGGGGGAGSASWQDSVRNYAAVNPATLAVVIKVTNTGSAAGTPSCTVQASDAGDSYTGVGVASPQNAVPPGATRYFADDFTITNQGAAYVTQVQVSCQ